MLGIVLFPLFLDLLPIHYFALCHGIGLAQGLIAQTLLGMPLLHGLYGSIVQNLYTPTAYAFIQVLRTEGLALDVEVCYVELESCAQCMAHHLLLETCSCHLAAQELAYDVYLAL